MASSVSLSAAVRANLMALQDTSALQAGTQQRLATGNKVNSALDNAANYFTAAALTARAVELTNLLDAMTSGINTLKAADNGLASISTTIQAMQATVIQARQDASWQSASFGLDPAAIGMSELKTIAFSGGAVGSPAVEVALNAVDIPASATSSSAGAQFSAMPLIPAVAGSVVALNAYDSSNAFTGGHLMRVDVGSSHYIVNFIVAGPYTLDAAINRINQTLSVAGSTIRASDVGGHFALTNTITGAASNFSVRTVGVGSTYEGGFSANLTTTTNGADPIGSVGFTITVGTSPPQAISITPDDVVAAGVDPASSGFNSVNLTAAVNAKLAAAGITTVQAVKSGAAGVSAVTDTLSLQATTPGSGTTFSLSGITGNVVGGTVTAGIDGSPGAVFTVDQLVASINGNAALAGKVRAWNDAGELQITNLSGRDLTVSGLGSSGLIDGSSGTRTIAADTVRANLVAQFNRLRDQLDKTAADASFNGINLLAGDPLKLYFDETGTGSITIQSTDAAGLGAATLGIAPATDDEFCSNAALDVRLQSLQAAARTVASQASAFGSNLSIVQNRQTFTRAMVTTLQGGADGLTLADGNQEGAGMLALQTRQQLSVQALALVSQANQAVLRLFG